MWWRSPLTRLPRPHPFVVFLRSDSANRHILGCGPVTPKFEVGLEFCTIQIFIHQLVVAKKIQYIHTYKYKEIQQTRKSKEKKQKMQCASVHGNAPIAKFHHRLIAHKLSC